MGQKNKFIKVVGVSTAIALSNIITTVAQAPNVTAQQIAQESDLPDTDREIESGQQPVSDVKKLNPSGNPLSFPTTPEEVQVDAQKPITLEQALQLSLKNNKEIEEARIQVERAEAELKQQKAALYPNLDLTSGLSYGNDLFLDSVTEQRIDQDVEDTLDQARAQDPNLTDAELGQIEDNVRQSAEDQFTDTSSASFDFQGGLGINYDIYNGGRRGASIRAAEKQLRSTELDLERIVEEARFETARDYFNLQNGDAQVEIQQAAVQDATQTLKDAQLLQKAGLGTKFEVLQAQVELAQAEQQLTTAIANQNIARRQLAETLSVSHSTDLATADQIAEAGIWNLKLPETIVQAFKNRAELEQSLLQREISQEQRTIALSQTRPNLSASANYSLNDDFEDDFDITDQYQLGLNLQWRLFDGGAASAGAEQADRDREIAETQFANLRNQIRFAVEQAFYQLRSNQNNIITTTKEVELATESLRLARLRFQSGVGTQTDVIDAQTALTRARGDRLSSIIDYNQSYADLIRQVSNTPDNGLQDLP
ncbi:transporter [Pleurocapsa sp. CCALA 161]|uniref:TolC family protein n=1 Tax=Pleurocapsa sp. CCALA 161 TaxID=2107688 RepID=UPI000D078FB3|nr:TolC family protein [Pleurocapsa sp. CCALA 161]PSB12688.1 transporter [Pleurocapsa sp. CCALA 161]